MKYSLNLLSIVLFSFFIMSCSSEHNMDDNFANSTKIEANRSNNISLYDYGFYHNEAITLYLDALNDSGREFSEQSVVTAITEMASLMEEKYPLLFADVDIDMIADFYSDYTYVGEYGFDTFKNNIISDFSDAEINSEVFLTFINEVYSDDNITYEEILEKINMDSDNSEEFIVFENILVASNSLWSSNPYYPTTTEMKCGTGAIIVDAGIGALLWFTGPVGILGAGFGSAIYNENCP